MAADLPPCQTGENISFSKTDLSANKNSPCPRFNREQASNNDSTRAALVVTVNIRKRGMPRCRW